MFDWLFPKRMKFPKREYEWTYYSPKCDCDALRNELRDVSVDRDAAQFALAKIKAQRSETTRRGNLTKSAKLKAVRNDTHRKLADENAARHNMSREAMSGKQFAAMPIRGL